jgi:hypothetical protein
VLHVIRLESEHHHGHANAEDVGDVDRPES